MFPFLSFLIVWCASRKKIEQSIKTMEQNQFAYNYAQLEQAALSFEPFDSVLPVARKLSTLHNRFITITDRWGLLDAEQRNVEHDEYAREISAIIVNKSQCIDNLLKIADDEQQRLEEQGNANANPANVQAGVQAGAIVDAVPNQMDVELAVAPISNAMFHQEFSKLCTLSAMSTVSKAGIAILGKGLCNFVAFLKEKGASDLVPQHALVSIILSKLDVSSQVGFSMWMRSATEWKTNDLNDYLHYRAQNIQSCETAARANSPVAGPSRASSAAPSRSSSAGTPYQKWKRTSCAHCNLQHPLHKCRQFCTSDYHTRMETVARARLCQNCLHGGHNAEQCEEGPCFRCNVKHNSVLCRAHWDAGHGAI